MALIIERSWKSGNERADNAFFWNSFGFSSSEVFIENTDGIIKGTLFEFKNNIQDLSKVLAQAIKYLSQVRNKGGIPVPSKICLIDISRDKAYIYNAKKYRSLIETTYASSASINTSAVGVSGTKDIIEEFEFDIDNPANLKNKKLKNLFDVNEYQAFNVEFPNILGWADFIYSTDRTTTKTEMFNMLRKPKNTFVDGYILPWNGEESDFDFIMDALNDPQNKKDLGAFYTPLPYVEKATKYVRSAIKQVPKGMDYVIIDRCAGTGSLEQCLTDEELSHVIINTYEIKEWLVLYNKYVGKVRAIIPPLEIVKDNSTNLVYGGDALSEEFLTIEMETEGKHNTISEVINDENVVIIGLENPPFSSELARAQEGNKTAKSDHGFIRKKMVKEFEGDGNHAKDLMNQFIWSFEQYYMRNKYDHYILFSPVKYWKSVGLMKKKFIEGFMSNRGNYKANESGILVAIWKNEVDKDTKEINVPAYEIWHDLKKWGTGKNANVIDIPKDAELKKVNDVRVKKVEKTLGELYSKKTEDDIPAPVVTAFNGYETHKRSYSNNAVFNENILAVIEASGFGMEAQDLRMTRIAIYHSRGSQVRKSNYHNQMALFVAKSYPLDSWYENGVLFTTADRGADYQKDEDFIRKTIIYTCISNMNKCLSFTGSDGRYYKNELCFDDDTIAYTDVVINKRFGELDNADLSLVKDFRELLALAKDTDEYNEDLKYGTYQIKEEINISYKDKNNKTVYVNEKVNTKLKDILRKLKLYYKSELSDKVKEYELVK